MIDLQSFPFSTGNMNTIDAEWLLANYRDLKGLKASYEERIRQLNTPSSEIQLIESMQLRARLMDDLPHGINQNSKIEYTAFEVSVLLEKEESERKEEIQRLYIELASVNEYIALYDAVYAGVTTSEKWIITQYYENKISFEEIALILEKEGKPVSKSTIRRKKLKLVEKVNILLKLLINNHSR